MSRPVQQYDERRIATTRGQRALKTIVNAKSEGNLLTTSNGAFGALGSNSIIHLNALKHNTKKNVVKAKTKATKKLELPLCVLPSGPKAEGYQAREIRGNTLFTTHNWGGHRK